MILDQFKLHGKVALVTGASRGLGQAMALGLAEAGAEIACVSQSGDDQATRQRVESLGRRFLGLRANISDPSQRVGLVDRVVEHSATSIFWSTTPVAARGIRRKYFR